MGGKLFNSPPAGKRVLRMDGNFQNHVAKKIPPQGTGIEELSA
jgi:hypothetical protein